MRSMHQAQQSLHCGRKTKSLGCKLARTLLATEGRVGFPPTPLLRPPLISSFSSLPSTRVHGGDPNRLSEEAEYRAHCIRRIVSPQQAGGVERANETLARIIGSEQTGIMLGCDYRLCARSKMGNVEWTRLRNDLGVLIGSHFAMKTTGR